MDQYNFNPKIMLTEVCLAMVHFYDCPMFYEAIAKDSFYLNGKPLDKAINTVTRMHLITLNELEQLNYLNEQGRFY